MASVWTSLLLLSALLLAAQAAKFKCVDGSCVCDTDEEIISCHNNHSRTQLPMPEKRLRGFVAIGITRNDLKGLPTEEQLLEKFPDLKGIDVCGNPNFNKSLVSEYRKIQILTCDGNDTDKVYIEENVQPTDDCDAQCVAMQHLENAKKYLKQLWKILLEKVEELRKHEFVKEVEKTVSSVGRDFIEFLRNHTSESSPASPECVDGQCFCNSNNTVADCRNNTELYKVTGNFPGINTVLLGKSEVDDFPSETQLLRIFPDLKQMEPCDGEVLGRVKSQDYSTISILSCSLNAEDKIGKRESDDDCDFGCSIAKKFGEVKEFSKEKFGEVKEFSKDTMKTLSDKVDEVRDSDVVQDIQDKASSVGNDIMNFFRSHFS